MPLYKVTVTRKDRASAHSLAGAMQELLEPPPDALTLFENGSQWIIDAYFSQLPDADGLTDQLPSGLGGPPPRFEIEEVPELNWVALSQASLPPVRAGRFVIHGAHDRGSVPSGPNAIEIEAGEAFGTAHHATTWGCLEALDRLLRTESPSHVLDLGCGSGVLAIAMARAAPRARILASDMDVRSVEVARDNVRLNRASARVNIVRAAGLDHPELRDRRFDLVVANILAGPLMRLAPNLASAVGSGKALILSGILTPQAPAVLAAYRTAGFSVERHTRVTGWSVLVLRRRVSRGRVPVA